LSYILSLRKNIANWGTGPVRTDSRYPHHLKKFYYPNHK